MTRGLSGTQGSANGPSSVSGSGSSSSSSTESEPTTTTTEVVGESFSDDFSSDVNFTTGRYLLGRNSELGGTFEVGGGKVYAPPDSGVFAQWFDSGYRNPGLGGTPLTIVTQVGYFIGRDVDGDTASGNAPLIAVGLVPGLTLSNPTDSFKVFLNENATVQAQLVDAPSFGDGAYIIVQGSELFGGNALTTIASAPDGEFTVTEGRLTLTIVIAADGETIDFSLTTSPPNSQAIEPIAHTTLVDAVMAEDIVYSSVPFAAITGDDSVGTSESLSYLSSFAWSYSYVATVTTGGGGGGTTTTGTPTKISAGAGASGALRSQRRITGSQGSAEGPSSTSSAPTEPTQPDRGATAS